MGAATALLAGCGDLRQAQDDTQPPVGTPATIPGGSWMLPEANHEKLLYVSAFGGDGVYVLSYPGLKQVGQLAGFTGATGVCSSASGNVFVTNLKGSEIEEFAHAGTSPIQTLADPGYLPVACAVDPATGDLAVTNYQTTQNGPGDVVIFQGSKEQPQFYSDPNISWYWDCTYDGRGNLFITGVSGVSDFAELRPGSNKFTDLSLSFKPNGIAWDGRYLTIGSVPKKSAGSVIDRVRVSRGSVDIVESVPLDPPNKSRASLDFYAFAEGKVTAAYNLHRVGLWAYPKGGTAVFWKAYPEASGVAFSAVPASR